MSKVIISKSAAETREAGKMLAERILKEKAESKAVFLGLIGDLGSGKTTFVQGFAKGLGIKEKIVSPTYVLQKRFKLPRYIRQFRNLFHLDLYRISSFHEILMLGIRDILLNPENIVLVEWPEIMSEKEQEKMLKVFFENVGKEKRKIHIS